MGRRTNRPIYVYVTNNGDKSMYWPKSYEGLDLYFRDEKIHILEKLSEMAMLVEKSKLARDIARFEEWQDDPEFEGDE